jgi:hypothetical protein
MTDAGMMNSPKNLTRAKNGWKQEADWQKRIQVDNVTWKHRW